MARTTPTSSIDWSLSGGFYREIMWTRTLYEADRVAVFFGRRVPDNVTHVELARDAFTKELHVRWRTYEGEQHTMPFEQTDEGVEAVLVAMKLTC